jgi:hypothetical protein
MSQPECPVCMVAFDENPRNTVTTECGHQFHYTCLFNWNKDNSNCPLCRHGFQDIEPAQAPAQANVYQLPTMNDFEVRDLVEPVELYGMRLTCQECNERVEKCYAGCDRLTCYCIGPQISRHITNRSPIQQQNTEYPTCVECWHNRYNTVHDFLDQQMTRDLMTEEIYDNDQMVEYYEMFFNNTNGNYVDEDGNLTGLQETTFTDYDEFLDHIRISHRRHIRATLDIPRDEEEETYEESEDEEVETDTDTIINNNSWQNLDVDNLFSNFEGLLTFSEGPGGPEVTYEQGDEGNDSDTDTELDEPVEIEHFELNVQPLCGPDGEIYIVDKEHMIYNMNGEVVGERIVVNGEYQIVMNN